MKAYQMVAKARHLPSVSQAALRLVGLLARPETSNDEVVEVLKTDSVLTAKLLAACNSPAVGLQEIVSSVDQAVLILGYRQIFRMVMRLAFGPSMAMSLPGYAEANQLWGHALMAACAGETLAEQRPDQQIELSLGFTIGLLHDIGKLVISAFLKPEQQGLLWQRAADGIPSGEAERELLGADHAEVGACLLFIWRLPDHIIEAVANHHNPASWPEPRPSLLAHAANCIAHLAAPASGHMAARAESALRSLDRWPLTPSDLEQVVSGTRKKFEACSRVVVLG
jgi:putative nucleotidyltransferase with HDIG domain